MRAKLALAAVMAVTVMVVTVLACSNASARIARTWNDLSPGPRVTRYDQEKDEIFHQESIVSIARRHRPGGEVSYSGNRMEAFRFHGKPGRGGIYDALEDYKRNLDSRKYQYRRYGY